MTKTSKYILGDDFYCTKAEIKQAYRSILDAYNPGEKPSREDQIKIWHLFRNHVDFEEKKGVGVSHFEVRIGKPFEFQNKCFYVIRKDGTFDDFSYPHCVTRVKKFA